MNYVYDYYLPEEKRVDFLNNSPRGNDALLLFFKQREISFKGDNLIYKKYNL